MNCKFVVTLAAVLLVGSSASLGGRRRTGPLQDQVCRLPRR